ARTQMYALQSCKHAQRSLKSSRLREVELHYFVSRHCARVLHVALYRDWFTGFDAPWPNFQAAVRKARIAESEAESIERLCRQITIGPAAHRVLFKRRDLAQRRIESQRKPPGRIIIAGQRLRYRRATLLAGIPGLENRICIL